MYYLYYLYYYLFWAPGAEMHCSHVSQYSTLRRVGNSALELPFNSACWDEAS